MEFEFKMSTAYRLKKKNIIRQMANIAANLEGDHPNGDCSYLYAGVIFDEVQNFFEKKGFDFIPMNSKEDIPKTLITVSSELPLLTDEELEEARVNYNNLLDQLYEK